jgi:hypothetical protein
MQKQRLGRVGEEAADRRGVERAVVGERERQRLKVAEVRERVVDQELEARAQPGRSDHRAVEREPGDGRRAGQARHGAPAGPGQQQPEQQRAAEGEAELEPPGRARRGEHAGERGAALEDEQRAQDQGERDRNGCGPLG